MGTKTIRNMIFVALLMLTHASNATGVSEWPFDQQVAESDLVVFATMSGTGGSKVITQRLNDGSELTRMRVLKILKGSSNIIEFDLVTRPSISELTPMCCAKGKTYLLLLRKGRDNIFEVTNGHYSAILVP